MRCGRLTVRDEKELNDKESKYQLFCGTITAMALRGTIQGRSVQSLVRGIGEANLSFLGIVASGTQMVASIFR